LTSFSLIFLVLAIQLLIQSFSDLYDQLSNLMSDLVLHKDLFLIHLESIALIEV
jgi:hypothetical protein